jgi:hypothetical protein
MMPSLSKWRLTISVSKSRLRPKLESSRLCRNATTTSGTLSEVSSLLQVGRSRTRVASLGMRSTISFGRDEFRRQRAVWDCTLAAPTCGNQLLFRMDVKAISETCGMSDFFESCVAHYVKVAGGDVKIKNVPTPLIKDDDVNDHVAAQAVMGSQKVDCPWCYHSFHPSKPVPIA